MPGQRGNGRASQLGGPARPCSHVSVYSVCFDDIASTSIADCPKGYIRRTPIPRVAQAPSDPVAPPDSARCSGSAKRFQAFKMQCQSPIGIQYRSSSGQVSDESYLEGADPCGIPHRHECRSADEMRLGPSLEKRSQAAVSTGTNLKPIAAHIVARGALHVVRPSGAWKLIPFGVVHLHRDAVARQDAIEPHR